MAGKARLRLKLRGGHITARELRTLLHQEGWSLERTRGSHEFWVCGRSTFVLATHDKELKKYQIRQAQGLVLAEKEGGR